MMAGVNRPPCSAKQALRTAPRGARDTSVSVEAVVVVVAVWWRWQGGEVVVVAVGVGVAVWSGPSGVGDDAARSGGRGEDFSC